MYKRLNETIIRQLAGNYGLHPNSEMVRSNAKQADDLHGKLALNTANGKVCISWGIDAMGYYDAVKLLDGYLDEETRVMRCDDLAAAQFERDAY